MSSFTEFSAPLLIKYDLAASERNGGDRWDVTQSFDFYTGPKENGEVITIPQGFVTDGATVPRLFWGLIPPWGKYGQAAVVHDYLCMGGVIHDTVLNTNYLPPRAETDLIFLEAMTVLKVNWLTREIMYGAVVAYRLYTNLFKSTDVKTTTE